MGSSSTDATSARLTQRDIEDDVDIDHCGSGSTPGQVMADEMAQQPDVVARLVAQRGDIRQVVDRLPRPLAGVLLVARGSSDHAAIHGRYLLELATHVPVSLAAPSLHTRYGAATNLRGWVAIALSQSGRTPEIVDTLAAVQHAGAHGLAITNEPESPLGDVADGLISLHAGPERAVPATKTFSAQVTAVSLLAEAIATPGRGFPDGSAPDWPAVVAALRRVLDDPVPDNMVRPFVDARQILVVARGLTYAAALEGSLKIAETTGIPSHGTSTADLLHGPIAATDPGVRAILMGSPGPCLRDVAQVGERLLQRGVDVTAIAPVEAELPASRQLDVPSTTPESLTGLTMVIRAQQVARALALSMGRDPDRPEGLDKVTVTD